MRLKTIWYKHYPVIVLVLFLVAVPCSIFFQQQTQPLDTATAIPTQTVKQPKEHVKNKNSELLRLADSFRKAATEEQKRVALIALKKISEERKAAMLLLMKQYPHLAHEVTLESKRVQLPQAIQGDIEVQGSIAGTFIPIHMRTTEGERYIYAVKTDSGEYYNVGMAQGMETKIGSDTTYQRAQVQGLLLDDTMVAIGPTAVSLTPTVSATVLQAATPTSKTFALIMFNWSNYTTQNPDKSLVQPRIFTGPDSIHQYFLEVSQNRMTIRGAKDPVNGDMFGWITIPDTIGQTATGFGQADCYSGGKMQQWMDKAAQMASAQYGDVSGYDYLGFVTPPVDCPGAVGFASGKRIWTMGNFFNQHLLAHELGHLFGLSHSNGIHCTEMIGTTVSVTASCTIGDDVDPYDPMGFGDYPHYNVYHKEKLGWYTASNIQTVTATGTYRLAQMEKATTGVQVLKIPRGSGFYYLEFRQPFGFDKESLFKDNHANHPPYNVFKGILIRIATNASTGYPVTCTFCDNALLDANPQTPAFTDAAFEPGRIFTDPVHKISIRTERVSATEAVVSIALNGSQLPAPTVAPSVTPMVSPVPTFVCGGSTNSVCITPVPTATPNPTTNPQPTEEEPEPTDFEPTGTSVTPTGVVNPLPTIPDGQHQKPQTGLIGQFVLLLLSLLLAFLQLLFGR